MKYTGRAWSDFTADGHPQVSAEAAAPVGEGHAFADCPGFLDNRGMEINVANAVNVKQTIAAAETTVVAGLGRIVALDHRASTSYQIHEHIRCLYF
jgi:hypothetical protein